MLLIVSSKRSHAALIADMIRYSGIICYPVSYANAVKEAGPLYRSVVILEPDDSPEVAHIVKEIRNKFPKTPIFALFDNPDFKEREDFDASYHTSVYSANFAKALADFARENGLLSIGDYRLAGIDASADLDSVYFFEKPVKLTKTESMILRFLIRSYPTPRKSGYITKRIYKDSHAPYDSSIRAHICAINRKFKPFTGVNLIQAIDGKGYLILTPDQKQKQTK